MEEPVPHPACARRPSALVLRSGTRGVSPECAAHFGTPSAATLSRPNGRCASDLLLPVGLLLCLNEEPNGKADGEETLNPSEPASTRVISEHPLVDRERRNHRPARAG